VLRHSLAEAEHYELGCLGCLIDQHLYCREPFAISRDESNIQSGQLLRFLLLRIGVTSWLYSPDRQGIGGRSR